VAPADRTAARAGRVGITGRADGNAAGRDSVMNTGLFRPASIAEALALLARLPDARIIAGGASLVAMINARLADPAALVSLARIEELKQIAEAPGGGFCIGAMAPPPRPPPE